MLPFCCKSIGDGCYSVCRRDGEFRRKNIKCCAVLLLSVVFDFTTLLVIAMVFSTYYTAPTIYRECECEGDSCCWEAHNETDTSCSDIECTCIDRSFTETIKYCKPMEETWGTDYIVAIMFFAISCLLIIINVGMWVCYGTMTSDKDPMKESIRETTEYAPPEIKEST